MHLRLQDYKTVSEYNSAMFRISSHLELCGEKVTDEDMLEKTFSTFHASNLLLQQQYREKGFKKYSQLISCLLVAEQNNELLMKNHEARPTGSAPFPEVNVTAPFRDRPVGSKDTNPRKRKGAKDTNDQVEVNIDQENFPSTTPNESVSKENKVPKIDGNEEISINYVMTGERWNRNEIIVDDIFAYHVAQNVAYENEDLEPMSMEECRHREDWPKWKEAIDCELKSLAKRKVFGPVVLTPYGIRPVGYKWVFVRKRNENHEVVRYKARLVAKGFSQRPGVDYEETYSPVVDATTFRFLISLAVCEKLEIRLMNVITAYLYGSLDNDIYMKIPKGLQLPDRYDSNPRELYSIKLQRSLYGLKQAGRMWYNRLTEYLLKQGYNNDPICLCVFIKRYQSQFVIIAVYVDDLNIIGTSEELQKAANCLKFEFEMKDLGRTRFCLGLQIEHLKDGIFMHQSTYISKILKRFYMDKAHPLSTLMVVRSLETIKDPFRPKGNDEELLCPEVPYLSAIGALMYLASHTRPNISFVVNLLARYSSSPTRRHWTGVKQIFRYLRGTMDMGLYYSLSSKSGLVGYADAGFLSDPHNGRSKTGYVFLYGGTAISWRSTKQTITATSSNHAEILAIHEASRECVWLRSIINHIHKTCGLSYQREVPTILYEDNTACIAQLKAGYIKGDRTKHISPKFFFTRDIQERGVIDIQQARSSDNLADIFTKALPTKKFEELVSKIGLRRLNGLKG